MTAAEASTQTPAPARGTSRRRTGKADGTNAPKVPTQRQGTAPTGTTSAGTPKRTAAKRPAAKAATAAGSLAAKAKAATVAAAGSTAAKTAAGKAVTARSAAAKAATAGATTARTAAARATTAAKAAAAKPAAKRATAKTAAKPAKPAATKAATAKPATAKPATTKAATTKAAAPKAGTAKAAAPKAATPKAAAVPPAEVEVAAVVPAAPTRPRPTPYPRTAESSPVVAELPEPAVAEPVVEPVVPEPVVVVEPVVETAPAADAPAALQADPADVAPGLPVGRLSWLARRRLPDERRRPAFYLAAGLIGALSMGTMIDADPPAHAETASVSHSISVAEQLGIEGEQTSALADPESTRQLQELVVSRNQRDAAQVAAADAQAAGEHLALVAAIEAARPKAVSPVDGARLTSSFGPRWGTMHSGIDLAAPMRTPEYAVMDGVVLEAGPASGFGLAVYIQHDNGDVTVYGHMDEILVQAGQVVRAGDTIALLGNRGQSTGPHLHFEVHKGGMHGTKVDPLPWLRERGVHI